MQNKVQVADQIRGRFNPSQRSGGGWLAHVLGALCLWLCTLGLAQAATVVQVAAGLGHTLAVQSDGTLWAWGSNSSGQLGNGSTTNTTSPVQIGSGYAQVVARLSSTVAIKADGRLVAWGNGLDGSLVPSLMGAGL